ncbi:UDP-phosphomannose--protein mannosyltransferase [Planctomycetales bacterium]|nr:UDP-phosphomannose--protein mannosyltransferase [Planctomycetales bacterium]
MLNKNAFAVIFLNPNRLFYGIALFYCAVWFFLPFFVQANVRPDTAEQFFIAKEWVVSATKHPTLTAWLLEIGFTLTGGAVWATYLMSSLAVFVILWSIWKLSNNFLPAHLALLTVLASCNYRYLNIGSTYFHNSVGILPFWALTVLLFYNALESGKKRYWILTGFTLGCGLLCKYPMGLLALTIFFFVVCFKDTRKYRHKLVLTVIAASLVFLPHIYWQFSHNFPAFYYAAHSGQQPAHWYNHIISPVTFFAAQLILLTPVFISVFPILRRQRSVAVIENKTTALWQKRFLPFVVLIPVLLQVMVPVLSGHQMPSRHGTHLWLFFPLFLIACCPLSSDIKKYRRAVCYSLIVMLFTMILFAGHWMLRPIVDKNPNDTLFPGQQLAAAVEQIWHKQYDIPIPYAAGEWKLSANLALYGKDRPTILAYPDRGYFGTEQICITPWVTKEDLYKKGAVLLWQIRDEKNPVPSNLESDYPGAIPQETQIVLPYQSKIRTFPPLRVGVAVIPPPKHK